jgi:hypothetical protein
VVKIANLMYLLQEVFLKDLYDYIDLATIYLFKEVGNPNVRSSFTRPH